ncbi:MAG: serine/threonine protein kinase [Cyanobacteria bacterium CRU_2_1]|nr:serine/threonine protein kinase [Cyanobacteria bacterium RU_5_0]NJR63084.1 serine/threonine protein kinase [Cyanobacteria bacterium CRU_2_1]
MITSPILPLKTQLNDRYRILRPLGEGGFSQVYEIDAEGATKVLKVLSLSSFSQSQVRQKAIALFQREAEFLSQCRHPGIPLVEPGNYFICHDDDQMALHCLVMEKIPGVTLQQWLQQEQFLDQERAIGWLRQLVNILAYLHQQQCLHRDIKPSNIMLKPDGQLVLIDFGAVRELTATYLRRKNDSTGTTIISAGYTPPEQIEGHAVPQSDFFALGRTFVCLFTRHDPLSLPKDPKTGQVIWRDRAPHLSPLLADLVDHLMAPIIGQRPADCATLLQMIARIERHLWLQRWVPCLNWMNRDRSFQPCRSRRRVLKIGLAGFYSDCHNEFACVSTLSRRRGGAVSEAMQRSGVAN